MDGDDLTGDIPPPPNSPKDEVPREIREWANGVNAELAWLGDGQAVTDRKMKFLILSVGGALVGVVAEAVAISSILKGINNIAQVLRQIGAIPQEAVAEVQRQEETNTPYGVPGDIPPPTDIHAARTPTAGLGLIDESIKDDVGPIADPIDPGIRETPAAVRDLLRGEDVSILRTEPPPSY